MSTLPLYDAPLANKTTASYLRRAYVVEPPPSRYNN
jgi:hypothetical protein